MNWPTLEQIAEMESTEAYKHYWYLPPATTPAKRAIIDALGDHAWKMRQEEDAGKPKRTYLPMPAAPVEAPPAAPVEAPPPPAPVAKKKPQPAAPKEEELGGSLFFLAALKR